MDTLLIFIIVVAIFGIAIYFGQQRGKRLIAEGKMIKRDDKFWNFAEIFTLTGVNYESVLSEINSNDFSEFKVSIYPNNGGRQEIIFKSSYEWNAKLSFRGESDGKFRYRFEFTAWNARHGLPMRSDTMNMMETKIEKIFLRLDPQATVEKEENKLTTKRKMF